MSELTRVEMDAGATTAVEGLLGDAVKVIGEAESIMEELE